MGLSYIRLTDILPGTEGATGLDVRRRFTVYQNLVEHEVFFFVRKRSDTLRLEDGSWYLLRREVELE